MPFNDIEDGDADEVYPYILEKLSDKQLAYVHVGDHAGEGWHARLRPHYRGVYLAGANLTRESGAQLLAEGNADAVAYGVKFLANPDLPERFRREAPLNEPDPSTFYTPGEIGYTDYPTLEKDAISQAHIA
jgi:N-ethylmaleimide reductase